MKNKILGKGSVRCGLIICAVALGFLWVSQKGGHMNGEEKEPRDLKTVCVGRFLLDIPRDMDFTYGVAHVDGWEITSRVGESDDDFDSRLAKREMDLTLQKNERGLKSLEEARDFDNSITHGRIFSFERQWSYHFEGNRRIDHESVVVEALVRINKISYKLYYEMGKARHVAEAEKILHQLRFRGQDVQPESSGFCFGNGILLDPIPTVRPVESAVLFSGFANHPDLAFVLSSMSGVDNDRNLLQRSAESQVRKDYASQIDVIFEGRREINGIDGEESSERIRELNGARGHSYMWESNAISSDVRKPNLSLELTTGIGRPGSPVNSSFSDKEAQALWNQISGSIRPRPVKVEAAKPEPSPLPERAEAGTPCPLAGRWSCMDHANGYDVVGGTTQKFDQGVKMPQVELLGPKPLFGRRKPFVLGTPTVWKLVKEPA